MICALDSARCNKNTSLASSSVNNIGSDCITKPLTTNYNRTPSFISAKYQAVYGDKGKTGHSRLETAIVILETAHVADAQRPDELFDVVNERDEVTGRQTRAEVHRLGLRHRAVHVLVFNRRGEVFLQKRSRLKVFFPGVWDSSTSGHLDSGEDYDSLRRCVNCARKSAW